MSILVFFFINMVLFSVIELEPRDNVYGISNYASGLLRIATAKGNAAFAKKLYAGPIMCDTEPYRLVIV